MSQRTAQCVECTTVFDVNATGRLPQRCPDCKKGDAARRAPKPKRRARASDNGSQSAAYSEALESLREEIQQLEAQITVRRQAIESLEAVSA